MAHFRATVQGNRGEASRLGTKGSGMDADINGWDSGVSVRASYNRENSRDEFSIYLTGGSGYGSVGKFLGKYYRDGDEIVNTEDKE